MKNRKEAQLREEERAGRLALAAGASPREASIAGMLAGALLMIGTRS